MLLPLKDTVEFLDRSLRASFLVNQALTFAPSSVTGVAAPIVIKIASAAAEDSLLSCLLFLPPLLLLVNRWNNSWINKNCIALIYADHREMHKEIGREKRHLCFQRHRFASPVLLVTIIWRITSRSSARIANLLAPYRQPRKYLRPAWDKTESLVVYRHLGIFCIIHLPLCDRTKSDGGGVDPSIGNYRFITFY